MLNFDKALILVASKYSLKKIYRIHLFWFWWWYCYIAVTRWKGVWLEFRADQDWFVKKSECVSPQMSCLFVHRQRSFLDGCGRPCTLAPRYISAPHILASYRYSMFEMPLVEVSWPITLNQWGLPQGANSPWPVTNMATTQYDSTVVSSFYSISYHQHELWTALNRLPLTGCP